MATDLTFIDNISHSYDGMGNKNELALTFYSATPSDTQAVHRFVRVGQRSYANGGHNEFEAVSGQNQRCAGVLIAHLHDDPTKESTGTVAVGDQARIIQWADHPVWVETATDLHETFAFPNVPIAADTAGYAVAAGSADLVQAVSAGGGSGVGWKTVGGKYFVNVFLVRYQAVIA